MGSGPHPMESTKGVSLPYGFYPALVSNFDVFDFELSEEEMGLLNGLDENHHVCLNHTELP
jgi:hypothetical protein